MNSSFPSFSADAKHWSLDPGIVFLNHGSFGATPKVILEKQHGLQLQLEREPVRFYVRELYGHVLNSLEKLAAFTGAKATNLVFVKNATMGVNTILHALKFNEGDEILVHSHAYGACANAVRWYAERYKLKVNVADIPFPVNNAGEVTAAFIKAVTPRTRLALVDHVTSATGIIFPVEHITRALQEKGVEVLVDGAHAPGMLPLQLEQLGAEYYTGNCHKWICSPKGSALLYVREDKHSAITPLQVSHHFDAPVAPERKWQGQFFWPGTDDFSAWCCVGDAIDFFENNFEGGWKKIREQNRSLTLKARKHISEKLGTPLPAPEEMIANLSTIYLRETALPSYGFNYISDLQEKLFTEYKIEVPVFPFNRAQPRQWVRIAAQLYNSMEQYEYLADALQELLKKG